MLTTGQLTAEISARAIALDPEWARRRYERSFHHRKVIGSRTPDGTATLSGTNLPLERVAAAVARLDDLAKTAKRAGDPRPIDHLRADLFLAMTDGTYAGLDDDQILQALLASRPEDATSASAADEATPDEATMPSPEPAPAPAPVPVSSWAGVHLKVRLSTLLGLDRYPAQIAGWGAVHAELARTLVDQLGAAQWRYTFVCPTGHLVRTGLTTARPIGAHTRAASCAAVIEILVPIALLPGLLPHRCANDPTGDLTATINPQLLRAWGPVMPTSHATSRPQDHQAARPPPPGRRRRAAPRGPGHPRPLHRPRLPRPRRPRRPRPPPRPRPRRRHRRSEPEPDVPPRPPRQKRSRLATAQNRRHLRMDHPPRPHLPRPRPPGAPEPPRPAAQPTRERPPDQPRPRQPRPALAPLHHLGQQPTTPGHRPTNRAGAASTPRAPATPPPQPTGPLAAPHEHSTPATRPGRPAALLTGAAGRSRARYRT